MTNIFINQSIKVFIFIGLGFFLSLTNIFLLWRFWQKEKYQEISGMVQRVKKNHWLRWMIILSSMFLIFKTFPQKSPYFFFSFITAYFLLLGILAKQKEVF